MRRFVTLFVLLLFTIPFGASIAGCSKKNPVTYCNGGDSGLVIGQVTTLTLQPRLTGISLNQGEIGQTNSPAATDCKGTSETVTNISYGTTNPNLVDIVPTTGRLCAGTWNRNTGGAIPDFTFCTSNNITGTAYVTATAAGVTSNPLAVYVHPIVTSIVLGAPSTNCVTDPASNCVLDATQANGCSTAAVVSSGFPNYTETGCVSQGAIVQLAARVYQGTNPSLASNNISCLVGPLTFSAQSTTASSSTTAAPSIVSINQNGQATAVQPGSAVINAATSDASSSAGFFSTCPPKTITLSIPGSTGTSISVNQNNPQQVIATVVDTNGNPMTNVNLEYVSTTPTTIPVASGTITPAFPGAAAITALCQPSSCNPAPFNQIGLFGNGLPVTSNPITVTTPGTNSSVIYIASTGSQYILPVDLTGTNLGTPVRLPFAPNSMVISQDLSTIYMGTATELMVLSTTTSAITREDNTVSGPVLAVSPNSATVVITDPVRKLTYLYNAAGGIATEYGAVGTKAVWTPDSSTVYITTADNKLLVYSTFTGWNLTDLTGTTTLASDIAVTVPNSGVFLAGTNETARTNCPLSVVSGSAGSQTVTNTFYPLSDTTSVSTTDIAATNDGAHVFGANPTQFSDVKITVPRGACPVTGTPTFAPQTVVTPALAGVTASAITSVLATSDSAFGFVTYTGTGGVVPQYNPATSTLTNVPLNGSATAPVAGVVSPDNQTIFLGTSGDNLVHLLTRGTAGFADSSSTTTGIKIPIVPQLPAITGSGFATPNLLVVRPRKQTS